MVIVIEPVSLLLRSACCRALTMISKKCIFVSEIQLKFDVSHIFIVLIVATGLIKNIIVYDNLVIELRRLLN